jgi:hypothetical protein
MKTGAIIHGLDMSNDATGNENIDQVDGENGDVDGVPSTHLVMDSFRKAHKITIHLEWVISVTA